MAKQFKFPDVGEGITEGEIVRWLVKEGDEVKPDQVVAEIETDKAVVEMPTPYGGTVLKLHAGEKDIVKVGQVLISIGDTGETAEPAAVAAAPPATPPPPAQAAPSVVGVVPDSREEIREILAAPRVRKLAIELGLDLKSVRGTGPGGRITEDDLRAARRPAAPPAPEAEPKLAVKIKPKFDFYGELEHLPLRGVRRATARHMREAVSTAAHVTHFDEADASELAARRDRSRPEAEKAGVKLTYLPFIMKAILSALRAHPLLNATLDDAEEEIVVKKYYNFGVAVDVPDGLIVPVVKGVDQKTTFELAREIGELAEAARKRTLDLADLKGGTFSITNVGMIGGESATPIINTPEVAILATMKIAPRPRAVNGEVKAVRTLPLCLSFDHRVVDGAEAARFMNDLIARLEDPGFLKDAAEEGKETT